MATAAVGPVHPAPAATPPQASTTSTAAAVRSAPSSVASSSQLETLAGDPTIPLVAPVTIITDLSAVDAKLAAARATDPTSAYALALASQDASLRAALSQVEIAPTSYGGSAEIRGLLSSSLA